MTIQKHIPYDIKYDSRNRGETNFQRTAFEVLYNTEIITVLLKGPLNYFLQYCYRFSF
jgi:hypothetical protein